MHPLLKVSVCLATLLVPAWAQHDLRFFVDPLAEKTGLTRAEVLLYLVSERLAQIAEQGVEVRLTARHDIHQHPPDDDPEQEEWKRK